MMALLPSDTWLRLIIWLAIGLVIYFAVRPQALGAEQVGRRTEGAKDGRARGLASLPRPFLLAFCP